MPEHFDISLSDLRTLHGNEHDPEHGLPGGEDYDNHINEEDDDDGDEAYSNGGFIDPELLGRPMNGQIKSSPTDPMSIGGSMMRQGNGSNGLHPGGLVPTGNGIGNGNGRIPHASGSSQTKLNPGVKRTMSENPKTCDNCRRRKIKCKLEDDNPQAGSAVDKSCEGCRKLGIECTFEYVRKRPGRKNGYVLKMKAAQEGEGQVKAEPSFTAPKAPKPRTSSTSTARPKSSFSNNYVPLPPPAGSMVFDPHTFTDPKPPQSTYTGPTSSFNFSPRNRPSDLDLGWLDSLLEGTAVGSLAGTPTASGGNFGSVPSGHGVGTMDWFSDQAHLLQFESPENNSIGSASVNGSSFAGLSGTPGMPMTASSMPSSGPSSGRRKAEPQVEDVTSWSNITHFISLFLKYLYPLLPLVHRPTFAEHLATRRDLRDTDFRALLLSIVAYVISQLPTARVVTAEFDIDGLKALQRKCHRTCKMLQRTYYGPTNLTQVTTIIFDMFYLLSIGLGHTAAARLGQATQLAFSMGMHSDERTNLMGLDAVEVQLRRRVFWQLYDSDKTRAIPGPPMLINDFQGVCSLPEPIDDDFITSQGMFTQPPSKPSVLTGFVIVSRLFRILSECFFYHRWLTANHHDQFSASTSTSNPSTSNWEFGAFDSGSGQGQFGANRIVPPQWTERAEARLHKILKEDMPEVIQHPESVGFTAGGMGIAGMGGMGVEGTREVFAMQRANILITAAIVKFALYDLRSALQEVAPEQLAKERQALAKEIHELLMGIPMEDLASNGESVRGKVLHITCALCTQGPMDEVGQQVFKDWWEMFSAISFVQMPPPPEDQIEESRSNSPMVR